MEENKLFRANSFHIVGKLTNADVKTGRRATDGEEWVSTTLTISNEVNGKSNEYEVNCFSYQMTKEGKESSFFKTYSTAKELVGKTVDVSGDLAENRYYSAALNQLLNPVRLNGKFIRGVVDTTPAVAEFTLGGFLAKPLTEQVNKNEEIYRYTVVLGQSNYKGDSMSLFTLHVSPADVDVVRGVESYDVGSTIELRGRLDFSVEQNTVTKEQAFGKPITRVYTNRQKNFYIESGSDPIVGEEEYAPDVIQTLLAAYNAAGTEIMNAAKNNAPKTTTTNTPTNSTLKDNSTPVIKRQTSLI